MQAQHTVKYTKNQRVHVRYYLHGKNGPVTWYPAVIIRQTKGRARSLDRSRKFLVKWEYGGESEEVSVRDLRTIPNAAVKRRSRR